MTHSQEWQSAFLNEKERGNKGSNTVEPPLLGGSGEHARILRREQPQPSRLVSNSCSRTRRGGKPFLNVLRRLCWTSDSLQCPKISFAAEGPAIIIAPEICRKQHEYGGIFMTRNAADAENRWPSDRSLIRQEQKPHWFQGPGFRAVDGNKPRARRADHAGMTGDILSSLSKRQVEESFRAVMPKGRSGALTALMELGATVAWCQRTAGGNVRCQACPVHQNGKRDGRPSARKPRKSGKTVLVG